MLSMVLAFVFALDGGEPRHPDQAVAGAALLERVRAANQSGSPLPRMSRADDRELIVAAFDVSAIPAAASSGFWGFARVCGNAMLTVDGYIESQAAADLPSLEAMTGASIHFQDEIAPARKFIMRCQVAGLPMLESMVAQLTGVPKIEGRLTTIEQIRYDAGLALLMPVLIATDSAVTPLNADLLMAEAEQSSAVLVHVMSLEDRQALRRLIAARARHGLSPASSQALDRVVQNLGETECGAICAF
jgi:hypothetical protein